MHQSIQILLHIVFLLHFLAVTNLQQAWIKKSSKTKKILEVEKIRSNEKEWCYPGLRMSVHTYSRFSSGWIINFFPSPQFNFVNISFSRQLFVSTGKGKVESENPFSGGTSSIFIFNHFLSVSSWLHVLHLWYHGISKLKIFRCLKNLMKNHTYKNLVVLYTFGVCDTNPSDNLTWYILTRERKAK